MKALPRLLSLRTWVALLLVTAVLLTLLGVSAVLMLYRLPQIEALQRGEIAERAASVAGLLDHYSASLEAQLMALAAMPRQRDGRELEDYLEATVGDGRLFEVAFLLDHSGRVRGVGLPPASRQAAPILRGVDFAFNPLFHEAHAALNKAGGKTVTVWSDRYLSVLTGKNTVSVAVASEQRIVVGEVALERLLELLSSASPGDEALVTIVDRRGQWLSSSSSQAPGRHLNYASLPVFPAILRGEAPLGRVDFLGRSQMLFGVVSERLHWVILAAKPAGLGDPRMQLAVETVVSALLVALLLSMALARLIAPLVGRGVQPLIENSRCIASGTYPEHWPSGGHIRELSELAGDLQRMAGALRAREEAVRQNEEKLETVFQASPTAMLVAEYHQDAPVIVDVNAAWERLFGLARAAVVGLEAVRLELWCDLQDGERFSDSVRALGCVEGQESWLHCANGQRGLIRIAARKVRIGDAVLLIVTLNDMTAQRRIEREILELNAELEQRVQRRTEELSQANADLAASLEHQRTMQEQLVQSEKSAALGGMVAGVAHELNTPVGNALMAATTMQQRAQDFRARLARGVRRSEFETFLEVIGEASDLAERNLRRAADLIGSFKQVAVDQASDQRRRFDLSEVAREILLTLQPSLRLTPYEVRNEIEPGFGFESYPGPLGQVLTNLISNAVLHAFPGRERGLVRLTARDSGDCVEVAVSDDGCGMPPEMLRRIFEPFFTSRRGRGGTGLGLHICESVVSRVLGGTITVLSRVGEGSVFTLRLPRVAPRRDEAAENHAVAAAQRPASGV